MEPERHDYHYDRKERLSLPGAPKKGDRKKGLFRSNRGLMILLIDVVIIMFVVVIYRQFLYEPPYTGRLEGYDLLLRGFALEDRIMVDLRVALRTGTVPSEERVFAVFTAGEEEIRLSAPIPKGDESVSLNGAILTSAAPGTVEVMVTIGDKEKRLRRVLDAE